MSKVINAIYEDKVFKPLQRVDLPEHEKVEIVIRTEFEWKNSFEGLLKRIHSRTRKYSSEEMEADITHAREEVQRERRG